jgi:hypothetical protein
VSTAHKKQEITISADVIVQNEFGRTIQTYDDGFGPLWIYRDASYGMFVVRAQSFEDAYGIVEDEFMDEADMTWEDIAKECECADPDTLMDNAIFQEAYGFRPNGPNVSDKFHHGIYAKDLNGDSLTKLTPSLLEHLKLVLIPLD